MRSDIITHIRINDAMIKISTEMKLAQDAVMKNIEATHSEYYMIGDQFVGGKYKEGIDKMDMSRSTSRIINRAIRRTLRNVKKIDRLSRRFDNGVAMVAYTTQLTQMIQIVHDLERLILTANIIKD